MALSPPYVDLDVNCGAVRHSKPRQARGGGGKSAAGSAADKHVNSRLHASRVGECGTRLAIRTVALFLGDLSKGA